MLPQGLPVDVELAQSIDTAHAAAGDLVSARLGNLIRGAKKSVLVVKGARITGRIIQMERFYRQGREGLRVGIKLEAIEVAGMMQAFDVALEHVPDASSEKPDIGRRMCRGIRRWAHLMRCQNPKCLLRCICTLTM